MTENSAKSTKTNTKKKILVLGAGNFGTSLANHLALLGHGVTLWARSKEVVESINKFHKNPKYLSQVTLASTLLAINSFDHFDIESIDAFVIAVPMQSLRELLPSLPTPNFHKTTLVCTVKGIEIGSNLFPMQLYDQIYGSSCANSVVVLSGPSFAIEIAQKLPTAVVAAARNLDAASRTQALFHSPNFRVYTSSDPIGLEVAAALKNVIAIAAGASSGLGFQMNSLAAIITRGLAEITRLGLKLGANLQTFQGLGGVGDLFLTCSSTKSRNFTLGQLLAQGKTVEEALNSLGSVAEGYTTAKGALSLAKTYQVDTPILQQVYCTLYEGKPVAQALEELLQREAKPEFG